MKSETVSPRKKRQLTAASQSRWEKYRQRLAEQGVTEEIRRERLLRMNRERVKRFREKQKAA
jgi:hypothetical protein